MSQDRIEKSPPLLAQVKKELADRNIVAFLGPVHSGKTVMAVLLNDALFKFFARKNPDYRPQLDKGFEYLKSVRDPMSGGTFPSPTLGTKDPIQFKIHGKPPIAGHVALYVHDMSGEDYNNLLASKDLSARERLDEVLRLRKERTDPYGPMSFLAVSKMYAVMVDCDKYSDWPHLDLQYSNTLNSLSQLQSFNSDQDRLMTPLAIILTKSDLLPDSDSGKGAEALIRDSMPQFSESMNAIHAGAREYFKFHLNANRSQSNGHQPDTIKVPWSYSDDEYVRFITWVLDNA